MKLTSEFDMQAYACCFCFELLINCGLRYKKSECEWKSVLNNMIAFKRHYGVKIIEKCICC